MDAYANRVEAAANSAEGDTRVAEVEMGRAQDKVEVTQKKILARFSSSPSFSLPISSLEIESALKTLLKRTFLLA